jgi:hypothetical protein
MGDTITSPVVLASGLGRTIGILIVVVPNFAVWKSEKERASWKWLQPEHHIKIHAESDRHDG